METLQISPNILRWAADQRGLSLDALVDLLDKPAKHDVLIAGKFSIAEAEKLAQKTHIPFGYFFLDTPPATAQRGIPDLRQLPNHEPLSIDFFDVLDDVLRKQQWYQEYLQEQGAQQLDFVGKYPFKSNLPAERVAADIQSTLGVTDQERKQCKNYGDFFTLLSARAESIGILVFKNGIVKNNTKRGLSVSEFRGFAIADSMAPVIFINGKDNEAAWIFTLAHEIAHIWLGESGVSDLPANQQKSGNKLEVYCNRVAAELLTPKTQFLDAWEQAAEPKCDVLSKAFKVSRLVIARRAFDLGKIDWATYQNIADASNKQKSSSGGDPYRNYPLRNSKRLTRAIVSTAMSGGMMLREAARLLNVRPDTVMELNKRLANR
ncbi:MAG: ImmA/IrrE family metallo-endopeptidase [Methylobacter sp.]|nr:ImmA/IrrE family metallo-endopeptidase [Methylobacter sp.]